MLSALLSLIVCLGLFAPAMADDADSGSGSSDQTGAFTDDITDTQNLLGSDLGKVTDAIAETKKETGVSVKLMYLRTFGVKVDADAWAKGALKGMNPAKNTVMLAVASDDGNLVVAVSSNSDEWLRRQSTVDDLSKAAGDQLLKDTPDWAGAATAMMDEIMTVKKTSTSGSSVVVGVAVLAVVLAVLVAVIVATIVIRRRMRRKVMRQIAKKRKDAEEAGEEFDENRPLTRKEIRMRRKAGMWKKES
ncbi:TPM domain-containing protein [Bifidobacterium sp. 82T10]|uniref:TPM domain-containing protein n=1 Tax=Bifidobacterium miconis TaxID=2834435 RepID=A0ABS6WBZ1_9BIFI|nr:TPM domain-containing protein [Bifidobacterium miconis]MBW3091556.1 TPM domain-containing protein [Bifidobacterium miconis]